MDHHYISVVDPGTTTSKTETETKTKIPETMQLYVDLNNLIA